MATKRRKLSAKQIKAGFGGKRRKAASRARPKHRARTKPNPSKRRRVAVASPKPRKRRRVAKVTRKRKNPTPMIISWAAGNPAKRRSKKSMAHTKKRRRKATRRPNAARRAAPRKVMHHRRRRHNPAGLGKPMDWLMGGVGVLAGGGLSIALPQMLLGASNVGPMGYAANAVSALALGWVARMVRPHDNVLMASVIAGGMGALLRRVITDKTPYGAALGISGMGDYTACAGLGLYQKSNYPYPPRVQNGRGPGSSMFTWGDGSQGMQPATLAVGGTDSTGAC